MNGMIKKTGMGLVACVLLFMPLIAACGGGDNGEKSPETAQPPEQVVITIGNFTDKTGPAASPLSVIDMALQDLVDYYNDENLIPGVQLKVVSYDGQWDPSRDIPGYKWLKEKGADLMWTCSSHTTTTLLPSVEKDQFIIFSSATTREGLPSGGYVFAPTSVPEYEIYTLLNWIAENDWDYQTRGPAKIGMAAWNQAYTNAVASAAEEYASAHPEQFKWLGAYFTDFTFTWGPQVEALKDADYVIPGNNLGNGFPKEYRDAGYTGRFISTDAPAAYMSLVDDARLWDELDGMLFMRITRWWNEEGDGSMIDMTIDILERYHPGKAEKTMRGGNGYLALAQAWVMLEVIREAAEEVGPENLDSRAIYEAANDFQGVIDGVERFTFNEDKRVANNYHGLYRLSGEDEDLFRLVPEWIPTVREP
ncbi:MAG: ABC transporter substrate-binding protein [Dehalococcoidia bacterium]